MDIPGYDIQRLVAQGGTSSVFVAVQRSLGRLVALKILRPLDGSAFAARFLEEGRIIASLNHRNVITIHDVGVLGGWYYIAMEYLEGGSLASRVNGGIQPSAALELLETIAGCLHFVHCRGVIHRDIKPANILFHADGTLRLSDFGIAKQLLADQDLTLDGRALGSPYYLSPEQAECKPLDGRSDIYSLGVVFYELLTGRKPFAGASHIETILAHLTRPVPTLPRELAAFQELLEHMIAKLPSERFATAEELAQYVRRLRSSTGRRGGPARLRQRDRDFAPARPAPLLPRPGLPKAPTVGRRQRPLLAMVPVVVLLAATAGLVGYRTQQADDVQVTSPPHPVATATTGRADAGQVPMRPAGGSGGAGLRVVPSGGSDAESNGPGAASVGGSGEAGQGRSPAGSGAGLAAPDSVAAEIPVPAPTMATGHGFGAADGMVPGADMTGTVSAAPAGSREANTPTEQEARAAEWLRLADEAIQDYRLTTPRNDSAWFYYRAALDQDPGNREAVAGLGRVADTYATLARRKLTEQDRDSAQAYVERGLAIRPRHPGLLELEEALAPPEVSAVAAEREVDGLTAFFGKVRAFVTHPANKPNTELLNQ